MLLVNRNITTIPKVRNDDENNNDFDNGDDNDIDVGFSIVTLIFTFSSFSVDFFF